MPVPKEMAMLHDLATGTLDGIGQMDHSVTSEYRILGPPGTGKTTRTAALVRQAVEKYETSAILVTSFSRAAAAELANRELAIGPAQLGTLHSICFHALGRPRIAEAHVQDWNRSHPGWSLTSVNRQPRLDGEDAQEDVTNAHSGDALLQSLNRLKGLMIGRDQWPAEIRNFECAWAKYKREAGLLDFCDLIEHCLHDLHVAPGRPAVIFADEAQDLNPMQACLLRKWGGNAEYYVLAGDDDQTIYSFLGATPEALLDPPIPADHTVVLRQSHRVPAAVHETADELLHRVSRRHDKLYLPRNAEGAVLRLSTGSYKTPEYSILSSAIAHLKRGKKIMFLASCSYMLQPVIQVLRKNAIPFHNPYRKSNGFWNPLRLGQKTATSRLISLLIAHPKYGEGHRDWTYPDMLLWTEWLTGNGVLKPGAQELLAAADQRATIAPEDLEAILCERALNSLLASFDGDWRLLLRWWHTRISPDARCRVQLPADVASKYGPQKLVEEPNVVVGTIHSVKGGEADVVYLFPDLSRAGNSQYERPGRERDSVLRLFYVGATRARNALYLPARNRHGDLHVVGINGA
jgi:superfamily I DNA/RNA helicase